MSTASRSSLSAQEDHVELGDHDHDHDHIRTVDQPQQAMRAAGTNPYDDIVWEHERELWPPMGVCQVTVVPSGYRLDSIDCGSVWDEGKFLDQASLIRHVPATTDPVPPQTPEQRARIMAAGARAGVEKADERGGP